MKPDTVEQKCIFQKGVSIRVIFINPGVLESNNYHDKGIPAFQMQYRYQPVGVNQSIQAKHIV